MKLKLPFNRSNQPVESVLLTADGFDWRWANDHKTVRWADVQTVTAFKRDLLTVDQVCLQFTFDPPIKSFSVTEDAAGFDEFVNALAESLALTNRDWRYEVTYPPFAESATLIYSRPDNS